MFEECGHRDKKKSGHVRKYLQETSLLVLQLKSNNLFLLKLVHVRELIQKLCSFTLRCENQNLSPHNLEMHGFIFNTCLVTQMQAQSLTPATIWKWLVINETHRLLKPKQHKSNQINTH